MRQCRSMASVVMPALVLGVTGFLVAGVAAAQTPEERGLEIAREADAADSGWVDSVAQVEMILRDRHGSESLRELEIRTLEGEEEGDKSLTLFQSPRDVRGTTLLTHSYRVDPDDQWLFLPAANRVRRIATQNQSGPFMGSEFAFEDLSSQEVEQFTYRYLETEPCPQLDGTCYRVERTPVNEYSGYRRQEVWLDTEEYRIDTIDYYNRRDEKLKTLTNSQFEQYEGQFWRPLESLMTNHQTGRSTLLRVTDMRFNTQLRASDFEPGRLDRIR